MRKIVLFSCFSPDIGGGGVNFRTQISGIRGWDITWTYLGSDSCQYKGCRTICLGPPIVGGPVMLDMVRSPLLWAGLWQRPVRKLAQQLADLQPDAFWILAMNEGVLVVSELQRLTQSPIHVSVQDDQEKGMFARMARYWWMARLASNPLALAIRTAVSVDVTSEGMQRYYKAKFGLNSSVTHLVMNSVSVRSRTVHTSAELRVGHIGTLYDESVAIQFADGLRSYASRTGRPVLWQLIGLSSKFKRLRATYGDLIEDLGNMPESAALDILAECDVVYAMYPFKSSAKTFRQTSFPTKMSTYVQAGRPIFAHTPGDSTMAEFVSNFGLGRVCQTLEASVIAQELEDANGLEIAADQFQVAAEAVFGAKNLQVIQGCLDSLVAVNA